MRYKSKTGIFLCAAYILFTIYCLVFYSAPCQGIKCVLHDVPIMFVGFPVMIGLEFIITTLEYININIRPNHTWGYYLTSWWAYILLVIITTVAFYFMGYFLEKAIKWIKDKLYKHTSNN